MKTTFEQRIIELLAVRNEDNKIEIEAEIYNILVLKMEETWKQLNKSGKITEKCVSVPELYL